MNLTELKQQPVADLVQTAHDMGLENVSRTRKQDIIFAILKKHAKTERISLVTAYSRYCKTASVSYARQTLLTLLAQTTSMSLLARLDALTCELVMV